MAVRGWILPALFLSCTILPLLTSAFLRFPGQHIGHHHHHFGHFHHPHDAHHHHHHHFHHPHDAQNIEEHKDSKGDEGAHFLPILDNQDPLPEEGEDRQETIPEHDVPKNGGQEPEEPIPEHDVPKDGGQEPEIAQEALREGFYAQSCPQAENVVNQIINKHFRRDPTLAAAIVRLFFHDCFVTGCDASILLDATPTGEDVEKKAPHNGEFVRGFEPIDDIKTQLETECPGVVSCADILAFANRDSLVHAAVPHYNVAAGRRDGLASLAKNVDQNLPLPGNSAQEIIQIFEKKGMTIEEMIVLSGAHSIGAAHCSIVADRFHDPEKSREIDRGYLLRMQTLTFCQNQTQDIAFDPYSHHKMDARFYKELLNNRALLESDHNLAQEPHAHKIMEKYAIDQQGWIAKFTSAIIKMGEIEVLTGNQGQIRKQCRAVN
ncbi:peroxidase 39-like [Sesamum indicum]|uniref:peroxidase n=1 Tax=Sesamum indicum TaxID=4182 RepID=A0A6I9SUV6_SESIN|nr:peroxidase 39-like [Sesamum indicum]